MQHFVRPEGMPPVNGYSHAVAFTGRMVVLSGQVPVDGQGELVGKEIRKPRSGRCSGILRLVWRQQAQAWIRW